MGDPCCGWFIVAASFLAHFLFYGVVYGIGVYYVVIEEHFSVGPTQVSLLCSVFTAVFFTTGPISAAAVNKFGCRSVMIAGGTVGSIGFIASSFVEDINTLFFTFGGVAGAGLGFCGPPSVVIIGNYFTAQSPLAFGLALSGVGFGSFAFPPIVRFLVSNYGLSGALLINGGLLLHLIICGAIYRPVDKRKHPKIEKEYKSDHRRIDIFQLKLFKDINFLSLCLNNLLAGFGQSVVLVHMAAFAKTLGFSKIQGAAALSAMGIANWLGRLFFGIIPQVKVIGFFLPYCTGFTFAAAIIMAVPFVKNYTSLCAISGAFGYMWGAFGALQPQTTLYVVGEECLASAFGYLLVFVATGSILGAPTAGYIYETTNSYPLSFYFGGTAIFCAGLVAIIPGYRMRAKRRNERLTEVAEVKLVSDSVAAEVRDMI